MHIVLDARMIKDRQHGIARYTRALIREFENADHQITLLVNAGSPLNSKLPQHIAKSKWISFREQFELPKILNELKPDLFHSPSFVAPYKCNSPFVITIHDMIPLAFHEGLKPLKRIYFKSVMKRAFQRAQKIITVSAYSKQDIIKYFGIPKDRIQVIYNGIESVFKPIPDLHALERVRNKHQLPGDFLLYVGNHKKHKNLNRALAAYRESGLSLPMVILGLPNERSDHRNVYFLDAIPEEDLPALYNLSRFVFFPSLYEGFGFPALEALACGKILVTSNVTSIPEVVGKAADLIDPYNVSALSQAMKKAFQNSQHTKINAIGVTQAEQFTWQKAARQTLEIYESCYRS